MATGGGGTSDAWIDFGRSMVAALYRSRRADAAGAAPDGSGPDDGSASDAATAVEIVAASRAALHESFATATAFSIVMANAGLASDDAEVLAVAAACEADVQLGRLLGAINGDAAQRHLTLGVVAELFGDDHRGVLALGADAPLRRAALVDVLADGPWSDHVVALHPSLVWALVGDDSADPDLPTGLEEVEAADAADGDDGDDGSPGDGAPLVVVAGSDVARRRAEAAHRCSGTRFLAVDAPETDVEWTALVREATITGRGVIVDVAEHLPAVGRRWIERALHLPWAITSRHDLPIAELPGRPWREFTAVDAEPTDADWAARLGDEVPRTHHLTLDQMTRVARVLPAVGGDLDAAVRRLVSGRMEHVARRIRPTRDWDDIVLSPDRLDLLRSIVDRYRYAGRVYDEWGFAATPSRGMVALFSGPSGTGKTLASEILAAELGLDMFKLDLSAVVSKYIGETEKNLDEVFDAASAGNLVLFFDEADALFGKRSEVKDARDRYANIEVSYLLQRLEAYDGLVVLATNFEKNIDDAFVRRIHARIEFALPGSAERRAIWEHNLPTTAPVEGVDIDWLAERFELSGGAIRNAAVHAAFAAAAAGTPIDMAAAVRGVAREQRKMGRLLRPADFGEYYAVVSPSDD